MKQKGEEVMFVFHRIVLLKFRVATNRSRKMEKRSMLLSRR